MEVIAERERSAVWLAAGKLLFGGVLFAAGVFLAASGVLSSSLLHGGAEYLLFALGSAFILWGAVAYALARRTPAVIIVRREEQLDVLGESYPLRELKKVRCHISYPFLADPYGTLRLVFSDGRKVRCRCVADVKEIRGRLIALMEEGATEEEP